ncbi:hypothetical protein N7468_003211 [Penicillium chermesinum]|uniref:Uncharacterized protein n=1 Tax=Penicillium chermesinum TaxID=63820 RepID=A0A9W9P694_9EURO|nr:uncharacterized protein N7468_003211 [Penicillium chermesinum]KAJ5238592.1 hypothetical protein N7468_003211 [Penicillium chermesinum]
MRAHTWVAVWANHRAVLPLIGRWTVYIYTSGGHSAKILSEIFPDSIQRRGSGIDKDIYLTVTLIDKDLVKHEIGHPDL